VDGACCFPGQTCQTETAADCGNLGGNFQGTGTVCVPNPCPPDPTGACCADDGTCSEVTEATCNLQSSTYQGDGSLCLNTECPIILEPYVDALPLPAIASTR